MKRKTFIFAILMILLFYLPESGFSINDDNEKDKLYGKEEIIQEQADNMNLDELIKIIENVNEAGRQYFPEINFEGFLQSLIKGDEVIDGKEIINGVFILIFDEVIANISLIMKLLVLAVICAVLTNLQSTFEKDTVGELAYYICYLIIIAISVQSFAIGMDIGRKAIEEMVIFMQALLPVLITLLIAVGGIASSALFHPVILGAVSVISTLMKDIILPLIFVSAIIGIISNLSNKIQVSKLSSLFRQLSIGIIGLALTVFIGIISIQGATAAKVDGITLRTAKFAIDNFIPIVGSFLSDAMDTVVGCSMLLKSTIGVIGLIVLFVICAIPIVKILSLVFVYKLTSAIIEPISDKRIVNCLNEIAKSVVFIFATVASVAFMFFIAITIIISAGNVTVMLR